MDEELAIQEELQRLKDQESKKKKKERRRDNERKHKEIVRMQMHMTTPMDIGMEQNGPDGEDSMFALKPVDKSGAISNIARGRMHTIVEEEKKQESTDEEFDSDSDGDGLEGQLDSMYEQYTEKKAAQDAKFRAKRARQEHEDGEWSGISDGEGKEDSSDDNIVEDDQSDSSDDEDEAGPNHLINDLEGNGTSHKSLTRKAELFFGQDIFKDIPGLAEVEDDSGIDVEEQSDLEQESPTAEESEAEQLDGPIAAEAEENSDSDTGFEVVEREDNDSWEEEATPMKNGRPDIDIITAEAMSLAHELATGKKTRADVLDDSFNKWTLRDTDGLPEWFLDDEDKHAKPQRPITAAGAAAIKEKLRALNARPIKKVMEARARKKFKAAKRLEKLRKKSALLLEDESTTEADKAKTIARMMARAAKKKPKKQVKLVVARGGNRGISGRPKGTKGRYKMVDARLKKDVRAEKRLKKKAK
jgi:AdoMet-dependent rRNA methyltransferase SPB1